MLDEERCGGARVSSLFLLLIDDCFGRPFLCAITRRFNQIALWVVKSIVELKGVQKRARRMSKLIDVAGVFLLCVDN